MCGPYTPLIMTALSTAVSAYGQYQQGQQAKAEANYQAEMADYQAKVDENNALSAKYQADNAAQLGQIEKEELRIKQARLEAQGINAYASSGVQLGTGSSLTWALDTADSAAREQGISDYNTATNIYGFNEQSKNFQNQALLDRTQGQNYRISGQNAYRSSILSAAGTVAAGAAKGYGQYQDIRAAQPTPGRVVTTRPTNPTSPGYYVMRR